MEYMFGLKTKDFVLLAADKVVIQSGILISKHDQDKSFKLGSKCLMLCVGEAGDSDQFAEFIEKNLQLYKMRNGYELSPKASAAYTRRTLADGLRKAGAYLVFLIIGGYEEGSGPFLNYMDYLATEFDAPYLMHGYGAHFCYSILDKIYRDDFTEAEAVDALKTCLTEVKKRFLINLPTFGLHIVDKNGIRQLDDICV